MKRGGKAASSSGWPQERNYMERPARGPYVRREVPLDDCVFCRARDLGLGFASLILRIEERAMVVLNKYPYNPGHVLVLPTRHTGDLMDLSESEFADLSRLLKHSLGAVKEAYECPALNIGMNHGRIAGAGIPEHLHWHVIPRWAGDTNFFPLIAETKVISETLEQSYERLLPYFE